jgi:hypothetical protein
VAPGVLDCSFLSLSHPMFDLGEGLFDRIKIGRVRRQIPEPCAGRPDGAPDGCGLVAAEIVHDDDVAFAQGWRELLFDVGAEAFAVDRPVEDTGRGQSVTAQRAEEGQRAPVAVRGVAAQPLAPDAPAAQRRHVRLDPGLVDEDEALRVEATLPGTPASTPAGNVVARLLKREQRFF